MFKKRSIDSNNLVFVVIMLLVAFLSVFSAQRSMFLSTPVVYAVSSNALFTVFAL